MTIKEWIDNPQRIYSEGVFLYKRFGNNTACLTLFENGENSLTRKKLLDELRKIDAGAINNDQVKPTEGKTKLPPKEKPSEDVAKYDGLVQLKNISFKEMASLHSQLTNLKTDNQRQIACKKIMELDSLIDDCWAQIDYYDENGTWPVDQDEVQIKTISDVVQMSKNIPTYFTKINAKLDKEGLSEADEQELLRQKNKWTLIKNRIELILDEPVRF
jgi:hypothetical protein